MPDSSSGVAAAIVVSHSTSRFEGPNPVTYAFRLVTFWLACMKNILSGGRLTPLRATTFSNCCTSAGLRCWSGSNLLNSGSTRIGETKTPNNTPAIVGIQNQNHQCFGDLRITQNSTIASSEPTNHVSRKPFTRSQAQLPHPCTDSPYPTATWCPYTRNGAFNSVIASR